MSTEFIPIYAYVKKYGIPRQTLYRWIREGKISKKKHKLITKTVKRRMVLDEDIDLIRK